MPTTKKFIFSGINGWFMLILLIFIVITLIQNVMHPLGESSDEPYYLDYALFLNETGRVPVTYSERDIAGPRGGYPPVYYALVASIAKIANLNDFTADYLDLMQYRLQNNLHWHPTYELQPYRGIFAAWHLGRLISLLAGAGVIAVTYLWARTLFNQPAISLSIAAFVAFIPKFIINSAVLSDDNLVAFFSILFLFLITKILQHPSRRNLYFIAGSALAMAVLTKYHAIVLMLSAAFVLIQLLRQQRQQPAMVLKNFLWMASGFIIIAGPWLGWVFLRFNRMPELGFRSGLMLVLGLPAYSGDRLVSRIPFAEWVSLLYKSFWLESGWMTLYGDALWYWLFGGLILMALWGWFQAGRRGKTSLPTGVGLALFQSSMFFVVILVRYAMGGGLDTPQGRHLFPALPGIALLIVLGWQHLTHTRQLRWLYILTLAYSVLGIISLVAFNNRQIQPTFPYQPAYQPNVVWPETLSLDGYQLTPTVIEPGQAINLDLYWETLTAALEPNTLFVQMINRDGAAMSQLDEPLPIDIFPRQTGSITPQQYQVWTGDDLAPGTYLLRLGLYHPGTGERRAATTPQNQPLGDEIYLGLFHVHPDPQHDPRVPDITVRGRFEPDIDLLGYSKLTGGPTELRVNLHWQATNSLPENYTAFVQLLTEDNQFVAGADQQPLNGFYGTTHWQPDEIVLDTFTLSLPADVPPGNYRLVTGMYRPETGERLPALDATEQPWPDNLITLAVLSAAEVQGQ